MSINVTANIVWQYVGVDACATRGMLNFAAERVKNDPNWARKPPRNWLTLPSRPVPRSWTGIYCRAVRRRSLSKRSRAAFNDRLSTVRQSASAWSPSVGLLLSRHSTAIRLTSSQLFPGTAALHASDPPLCSRE